MSNIRLFSYTQPAEEFREHFSTASELIAFCARVSNPANQYNNETSDKLIDYLQEHKHWSPFEMAHATLEITTTRDISHQIIRHRSFAFQEFSQRYANPVKELEFWYSEARLQDSKNRQNSIETEDKELHRMWMEYQAKVIDTATEAYHWAVSNGLAKEVARKVLPEGLTVTRLYMSGSIRSWIHYVEVRSDPSTQKEHREIAVNVAKAIAKIFPMEQYVHEQA